MSLVLGDLVFEERDALANPHNGAARISRPLPVGDRIDGGPGPFGAVLTESHFNALAAELSEVGVESGEFPTHIVDRKRRVRMQYGPQFVAFARQRGESRDVEGVVPGFFDLPGEFPEAGKNLVACQIGLLDVTR